MAALQNVRLKIARLSWLTFTLIAISLWLIIALVVWWRVVYADPKHVFEGMLESNFTNIGYTRQTSSKQQGLSSTEYAQVQTGHQNLVRTLTILQQQDDKVITDAISTSEHEYVRYTKIDTSRKDKNDKPIDFSSAVNVWAKAESDGSNQALAQMLLGLFPMGNVPAEDRDEILKFMKENSVFNANYARVKKETVNGRPVYTYEVQLLPQPYIDMLKRYGSAIGLKDQVANLNPADYADSEPTTLTVSVDVLSRHLRSIKLDAASGGRAESYSAYGIRQDVALPTKTITTAELQQRLSIE